MDRVGVSYSLRESIVAEGIWPMEAWTSDVRGERMTLGAWGGAGGGISNPHYLFRMTFPHSHALAFPDKSRGGSAVRSCRLISHLPSLWSYQVISTMTQETSNPRYEYSARSIRSLFTVSRLCLIHLSL